MKQRTRFSIIAALMLALPQGAWAQSARPPQVVPVGALASPPVVDGVLGEWGNSAWTQIKLAPAVAANERKKYGLDPEDRNVTGVLTAELKAGVAQGRLYVAVRWPDSSADTEYKGWEWLGGKYIEGKKRDDALALRFHMSGDFDRSMMSAKNYQADVWFWSAARTNPSGLAEDWTHHLSVRPIEDAAEYEVEGVGTVYIKKIRDSGSGIYKPIPRPKEKGAEKLPSFELIKQPTGSVADVGAKGRWTGGKWALEMVRLMNTGHADDVVFSPGKKILGQLAVFNRGSDENKSVSEPLLFDFSAAGN